MLKKLWTNEEVEFLKTYAPNEGTCYCAKYLNRTINSVFLKCNREGILLKRKRVTRNRNDFFDPTHLTSILTPESVYTLGFIWGDGHVSKGANRRVVIKIAKADADLLAPIFNVAKEWKIYFQAKRKESWSDIISFYTTNSTIYNFLLDNNYANKSGGSPELILSKIPDHFKPLFFRGLSDADGCFYVNSKSTTRQYQLSSCLNQDWTFIEKVLQELGIVYKLERNTRILSNGKTNSSSAIRFNGAEKITKWGKYIYSSYGYDGIGLPRKHSKYVDCFRLGRNFL